MFFLFVQAREEAWLWTRIPLDSLPLVFVCSFKIASLVDARAFLLFRVNCTISPRCQDDLCCWKARIFRRRPVITLDGDRPE